MTTSQPAMRFIETDGVRLRIAEMGAEHGDGPLVLLLHGWPESWYSWRHQLPALAAAGYHAVAPDMRGYGASDAPEPVEAYDIEHICGDVEGLIDACGEEQQAVVVGHDWGAILAWQFALLRPERCRAVVGMSVPYTGRGEMSIVERLKAAFGDDFFYILYFQQPGVAEAEFDADPRGILGRLYSLGISLETAAPPRVTDPKMSAGGWIDRLPEPRALPPWLSEADLDYFVGEFTRAGFRGGINYYRNFQRNWDITPQLDGAKVEQPSLFVAGADDGVLALTGLRGLTPEQATERLRRDASDLRRAVIVEGAGHWIQQERPAEVNEALLDFLRSLG